jgi:hypothetical protein
MEFLIAVVIIAALVVFVSVPLRRSPTATEAPDSRLVELEARKQAKYAEIRDTQLDHAAGKLSEKDFEKQDAELRAEAIKILKEMDRLSQQSAVSSRQPRPGR